MMRSIGLVDTEMYGGYDLIEADSRLAGAIPLQVDSQPCWGSGKRTTAYDLAQPARGGLARERRAVARSAPRSPASRRATPAISSISSRTCAIRGKLDSEVGPAPGRRGAAQGRLDQQRTPRQRPRGLARRRVRRHGDDLPPVGRRRRVGPPRRSRRRRWRCAASAAEPHCTLTTIRALGFEHGSGAGTEVDGTPAHGRTTPSERAAASDGRSLGRRNSGNRLLRELRLLGRPEDCERSVSIAGLGTSASAREYRYTFCS